MSDATRDTQGNSPPPTRLESLRAELKQAFARGEGEPLNEWVSQYADFEAPVVRIEFLRAVVAAKRGRDETLSPAEFHERYPDAQAEIESVFGELASTDMRQDGTEIYVRGAQGDNLPGDLFSAASMAPGGARVGDSASMPEDLGDYQLLDKLGEGGMGLVYSARQQSADRVVALKIVRPERLEAYSSERKQNVIDRFRTEAQSAAQLEHENIVTVYDVGEIDGQHYYSMRLVEGCSLAEMLADGPMLNDVAARYLRDTARGIAEAHTRGILHRDLKPQNIMVDVKTDRAMVADFGLAKVVGGDTELTRDGEIVGTPQYMAPEQIQDSAHVTAAADIYAIGATLYHLLTGRPPFQAALAVDTLRQVMLQDPAPPRQLNAAIDLDLETICLKCLEKEPTRRYETAGLVADELDRYLRNEPILARPLGPLGRGWRWCRRNPGLATAISAAIVGLLLALTATTIGYLTTAAAQAESDRSFRDALAAVNRFFSEVSEDSLLHAQGMQPLRKELLNLALDYYQKFLSQRQNDPTVRRELAGAYYRIGLITAELDSSEAALPFYNDSFRIQSRIVTETPEDPAVLRAMGNLQNAMGVAYTRMGKLDLALDNFTAARLMREKWKQLEPDSVEPTRVLANTMSNLAHTHELMGDADEAVQEFQLAQSLRKQLLEQAPDHRRARRDYAEGYYNLALFRFESQRPQGNPDELLPPDTVESLLAQLQQAIDIFEQLQQEDSADISVGFQLSQCLRLVGDLYGDDQNADRAYDQAREQLETLVLQNPTVSKYVLDLASLHRELGRLANNREQFQAMARNFKRATELLTPHVAADSPTWLRLDLAISHMDLGIALGTLALQGEGEAKTNREQAVANLNRAAELFRTMLAADPRNEELQLYLEDCQGVVDELKL